MQPIGWYIRRLQSMGPAELIWRVKNLARDQIDLARIPLGLIPKPPENRSSFEEYAAGFRSSAVTRGTFDSGDSAFLTELKDRLAAIAEPLLRNKLSYFDLHEFDHGEPFNWHRDHSAGIDTPTRFSVLTDYRDFKVFGDCKLVWEPNRHHHLVVLARAYVTSGDSRYAEKVASLMRSWIDANPFGYGMNWKSILEHGVRLINWVWALDLIRGSHVIDDDLWMRIRHNVYLMIWDIQRKYSKGSSANNHLIGEAAGVFIATSYFADLPNAKEWRRVSQAILEAEILKQTYCDGCTREHTFGYELFVAQFFLLTLYADEQIEAAFSNKYRDRLHQMFRFLGDVASDTGQPPNINDCDDGYVLDLGQDRGNAGDLISVGGRLFEDDSLVSSVAAEPVFWLFGENSSPSKEKQCHSRIYKDSGYAILRSERLSVFFDCAELGYGPIAAHGHADCLSFLLSIDGNPVFIDPGTYDYFSFPQWRRYFRETKAHNTVVIDDRSQSQILGPFMWGRRAKPTLHDWQDSDDRCLVVGSHDGYMSLSNPLRHTRKLLLDKKSHTLTIEDTLTGSGPHDACTYFHLAPTCKAVQSGSETVHIVCGDLKIEFSTDSGDFRILQPLEAPSPGWVSDGYHRKDRSSSLVLDSHFERTETNTFNLLIKA